MAAVDVTDREPDAWLTIPLREYLARTLHEMAAILSSRRLSDELSLWQPPETDRPLTPLEADVLADIKDAIIRFAEAPKLEPRALTKSQRNWADSSTLTPFPIRTHVHYALKTTAAAMFCYLLYSLLDWPGIHTCFITCYIVSLGTTAETVEKLTLRILGCLVGAAAGYWRDRFSSSRSHFNRPA